MTTAGDIQSRNDDGTLTGSYSSYSQAIIFGIAKAVNKTNLGFNIKYLQSGIENESYKSFAVDFGMTRQLNNLPLSIGFSVQNLGNKTGYINQKDDLPLSVSVGSLLNIAGGFGIAADVKRLVYEKETTISLGTDQPLRGHRCRPTPQNPNGRDSPFLRLNKEKGRKLC